MHPDDFLAAAEAGHVLTPTDKNYKVCVDLPHPEPDGQRVVSYTNFKPDGDGWLEATPEARAKWGLSDSTQWFMLGTNGKTIRAKFYFMHLSDAQMVRFVELLNAKKVQFGYPGYFYRLPYFITREQRS